MTAITEISSQKKKDFVTALCVLSILFYILEGTHTRTKLFQKRVMIPPQVREVANQIAIALEFPDWFPGWCSTTLYSIGGPIYDYYEKSATSIVGAQQIADLRKYASDFQSPIMKALPLADPMVLIFWLLFYLAGISLLYPIGKFVAHPAKLEMKTFSLCHNAFLFVLSLYMAVFTLATAAASNCSLYNNAPASNYTDPKNKRIIKACWIFVVSKIPEFIDTFIMMLKQNYHQVSFLHVYHHLSILIFVWGFATPAPGGDCFQSVAMNSIVHVFMYGYYFGCSFAGKTGHLRNFLNSIKFMITKGQLTQFALNFAHGLVMVFVVGEKNAKFPLIQMKWMLAYMASMLILFGQFLLAGQKKERKPGDVKAVGAEKKNK